MKILLMLYWIPITFFKIARTQTFDLDDLIAITKELKKFYLTRSVVIVYDKHQNGFDREHLLLNAIRQYSDEYYKSQVITYDKLDEVAKRGKNILQVFLIHDEQDLQSAINATNEVEMYRHPWFLYFTNSSSFNCDNPGNNFFKLRMDIRVTAKCEGNRWLKWYYATFENQTEVHNLAEWLPDERKLYFMDTEKITAIEMDMKGITLKLAKRDPEIERKNENLSEFLSELMDELKEHGNFKTNISVEESTVGFFDNRTHHWTGLINDMYEKKADIGMFLFSMSKSRVGVVDFAEPLERAHFYLYAKLPETKMVLWSVYFKGFDWCVWLSIGLSIFGVSILLSLIKNRCQGHIMHDTSENFLVVWGIHCQQGPPDPPSNTVVQIIYLSILFSSLVLNAIYSATITSYIAHLSPKLPFDTYEEFKRDNSYKVTVLKGSQDEVLILGDDEYVSPLKSRLRPYYEWPLDPHEGYQQACEENMAFYSDDLTYDGIKSGPTCQLGKVDMERDEYLSFVLTKGSPYLKTINYYIARLRDHGILQRLKNRHFYKFTELPTNEPNVITFPEALPIITVWLFGVILSMIIWLLEWIRFHLF